MYVCTYVCTIRYTFICGLRFNVYKKILCRPTSTYTLLFKSGLFCVESLFAKKSFSLSLFSQKPFLKGRILKIHIQKKQFCTSNFSRILHNFSMVSFHFFTIIYTSVITHEKVSILFRIDPPNMHVSMDNQRWIRHLDHLPLYRILQLFCCKKLTRVFA